VCSRPCCSSAHRARTSDAPSLQIYSCNEGNYAAFPRGFQRFLDDAKGGEKPYSLRYVGSMVADVHRTLLYGGIFAYGPTLAAPGGKLRLLYEVNPMSMIMEQAGGKVRGRWRRGVQETGWRQRGCGREECWGERAAGCASSCSQ